MELHLFMAVPVGPRPDGSNDNFVLISNNISQFNIQIRYAIQELLKPLSTFPKVVFVIAMQFVVIEVWKHISYDR